MTAIKKLIEKSEHSTQNISQKKSNKGDILHRSPFALGRYFIFQILFFFMATAITLAIRNPFETISYWWILSLFPLFFTRMRYVIAGFFVLATTVIINFSNEISLYYYLFFPVALYLGHLSAVLIHNCTHGNFRPKWLNPVIGEILALHQLSGGYELFKLVHLEHHMHSDDPEKDPHPSAGYSFFEYVDAVRVLVTRRLTNIYSEAWNENKNKERNWKLQIALLFVSRFFKTLFMFCLLGPKIFALFFVPSYISIIMMFAIFNYFTHVKAADGSVEILNLNDNFYYYWGNKLLFGVFYHKNHHRKPKLFNPMKMKVE